MREPNNIQKKIWRAFQKVGNKLPSGEFRVYHPTQFQVNPIQDVYLKGITNAYLQKKGSSSIFGGLVRHKIFLNVVLNDLYTVQVGDYIWDDVNDLIVVITDIVDYGDIEGIVLPNRIQVLRTDDEYQDLGNGAEAVEVSIVESLPCIVEFGAFTIGGLGPGSVMAQGGFDEAKITTAIDPSLLKLGDVVVSEGTRMSVLNIIYTPATRGCTLIAKVMG